MEVMESEFFAPVSTDLIDGVLAQYRGELQQVQSVNAFLHDEGFASVVHYFIQGNGDSRNRFTSSVERMFSYDGALAALNAHYWNRIMHMTDVLDCMPAARREEWFKSIEQMDTPDFEESTVRATIGELLATRGKFLAERVDGIFQALSRTHVTNQPEGFSKRMIMTGVTNDWGSYGRTQTGHINDLRSVIAKFMGRDEPDWNASNRLVEIARRHHRGEWIDVDGGAMRIRCYLNGNAHLDIHPDIAWRLNQILAHLHPAAIPSQFREKPKTKRKVKDFELMERPLPFAVLLVLSRATRLKTSAVRARPDGDMPPVTVNYNNLAISFSDRNDKYVLQEAERVLAAIGGVKRSINGMEWFEFDYDPAEVVSLITVTGAVPDSRAHQYYPTPDALADRAVELADIGEHDLCLEPSAGTGALADRLPAARTMCVEVNQLHATVLQSKGHQVHQGDFLEWSDGSLYDRIVMNPPFSQGRWQAHVEAAAALLTPSGRLVAIVPASAHNKHQVQGFRCTFDGPHDNQFTGTSVSVTIMILERE